MALKSVSNTAVAYQETSRPLQTMNRNAATVRDGNDDYATSTGISEMSAASKVLNEQQGEMNESGQQKSDDQTTNAQRLKSAVSQANIKLKQNRTRCEFSYNEEVNRVSIKVLDRETQEIIREIPPEESLEMLEKMWEIAGLLVDERR